MINKFYLKITVLVSIFLGIILPLTMGVKDPTLIAITFTSVWFIYAVLMFVTVFLIKPGLKIKILQRKNPTIVRYELRDAKRSQSSSHDSVRVSESTSLTKVQKD
jgi:hypothetical protein